MACTQEAENNEFAFPPVNRIPKITDILPSIETSRNVKKNYFLKSMERELFIERLKLRNKLWLTIAMLSQFLNLVPRAFSVTGAAFLLTDL